MKLINSKKGLGGIVWEDVVKFLIILATLIVILTFIYFIKAKGTMLKRGIL